MGCNGSDCEKGYNEKNGECVAEPQEWRGTGYTFDEIVDISSSLLMTLDADEMCAEASNVSVNGAPSKSDECVRFYTALQENLPSFAEKTTDVNVMSLPLQVYSLGEFVGYYTGIAFRIEFTDTNTGAYLETNVYRIEKGCRNPVDFFYKSVVCYSSISVADLPIMEDVSMGCQEYMPAIVFAASLSECPEFNSVSLSLYDSKGIVYQDPAVTDPVVLTIYTESAETLEELLESVE